MSAITVTPAQVSAVRPDLRNCIQRSYTCLEAVTAGASVYLDPTTGKVGLCDANAAGKEQFLGITLHDKAAGEVVLVHESGELYGFDVSGLSYGALIYQGDTAGVLDTAASGTKTIRVGKVTAINDATRTKVIDFQRDRINNW